MVLPEEIPSMNCFCAIKKTTRTGKKKTRAKNLKAKRNPRGGASVRLTNPARSDVTITSGLGVDKIYKP